MPTFIHLMNHSEAQEGGIVSLKTPDFLQSLSLFLKNYLIKGRNVFYGSCPD
jgi:hypothetical protein